MLCINVIAVRNYLPLNFPDRVVCKVKDIGGRGILSVCE